MEEWPKLLDYGVVCKFYNELGVAGGAPGFQSGGTNNVELCTRPDNIAVANDPVGQEQTIDSHKDKGAKMETGGGGMAEVVGWW